MKQKWKALCCLALAFTAGAGLPTADFDSAAHAQDRGERARSRIESRERAADRLQRLQRLEALRRAERAAASRLNTYRNEGAIAERREAAIRTVIRNQRGQWVARRHILSIAPDADTLEKLRPHGFDVARRRRLEALDLDIVVLRLPQGMTPDAAIETAQRAAPNGRFVADHLYDPSGRISADPPSEGARPPLPWSDLPPTTGLRIGLVDLGIDTDHPALLKARITARNFIDEGNTIPSSHGTAVASLLVGQYELFKGSSSGAELLAADVFGDSDDGGSVEAIVGALDWLASERTPVIAMPLAGPPNLLLEMALERLAARGVLIVAPVGNNGPTEPVAFPAAYPFIVAVTATDSNGHVFLTAHRGPEVMLSAVGVGLPAAADPNLLVTVEGTSFAVPEVAARLLRLHGMPDKDSASTALERLAAAARDLGAPGRDPVYGEGWVSYPGLPTDIPLPDQRRPKE